MRVLVVNGPNLSKLGVREPHIYGTTTLKDVNNNLKEICNKESNSKVELICFQSDSEGEIVSYIGDNLGKCDALIVNLAGYTHTSVAIRDAITMLDVYTIEVHISNIYAREEFRKVSFISPIVAGVISGLGINGYTLALNSVLDKLLRR